MKQYLLRHHHARGTSFFSPKNQTCIFTGRSSDSASSPWIIFSAHSQWYTDPSFRLTAAVLSEIFTPFPILPALRGAPVNTRLFNYRLQYSTFGYHWQDRKSLATLWPAWFVVVHFSAISLAILFGTVFWPYWTFEDIKLHFALHNSCRTRKIGKWRTQDIA